MHWEEAVSFLPPQSLIQVDEVHLHLVFIFIPSCISLPHMDTCRDPSHLYPALWPLHGKASWEPLPCGYLYINSIHWLSRGQILTVACKAAYSPSRAHLLALLTFLSPQPHFWNIPMIPDHVFFECCSWLGHHSRQFLILLLSFVDLQLKLNSEYDSLIRLYKIVIIHASAFTPLVSTTIIITV